MVNVLVIGSGGREHALSWKLSQSELVDDVYGAPGNGGTSQNIPISVDDIDALANFAQEKSCFTMWNKLIPTLFLRVRLSNNLRK